MSLVATAPHEVEGNLVYAENGLSPYWMVGKLLHQEFHGYSGEIEVELDGEKWNVELAYQKGGIAPREEDDLDVDRLYEYRINVQGDGQRKLSLLVKPRFPGMQHYETGQDISAPFDRDTGPDEGVNVQFQGSNIEPDLYPGLLWEFVQALASEAGTGVNHSYFRTLHEWSNIYAYERYVRVRRSMAKKYIRNDGVMRRLWELVAGEEGSQAEYKVDNRDIVGYNHRLVLPQQDAARLAPGHELGKQLKHLDPTTIQQFNTSVHGLRYRTSVESSWR